MNREKAVEYAGALVAGANDLNGYRDEYKGRFFHYYLSSWTELVTIQRVPRMVLHIQKRWGFIELEEVYYPPRNFADACQFVFKIMLDKVT